MRIFRPLFLIVIFSLLILFSKSSNVNAQTAGCQFSVSTTTVAPHGSFTVTVSNMQPNYEYIIRYENSTFYNIWIANSTGNYSTTASLDQIYGANSPQAVSGTFQLWSGNTVAQGGPGSETCSPQGGISITVDPNLTPPPLPTPSPTPTPTPTPIQTPPTPSPTPVLPATCTINASSQSITLGQSTTLFWTASSNTREARLVAFVGNNMSNLTIINAAPALFSGSQTINPTSTLSYALLVLPEGGSIELLRYCITSVTVTIPTPSPTPTPTPSPTPIPTPSPTPTPPPNNERRGVLSPRGVLDGPSNGNINCSTERIYGWAFDWDMDYKVPIHVYIDRHAGTPGNGLAGDTPDIPLTADQSRPDLITAFGADYELHGFSTAIPSRLSDGQSHTIRVYPLFQGVTAPEQLPGSPRTFTCSGAVVDVGGGGGSGGPGGGLAGCVLNFDTARSFNITDCFQPSKIAGYGGTTGVAQIASDILLILTSVAAAMTVIFVVIAGIKFVTSGGDPKKTASASSTLTYAIIGIVVTILAFVILRVVQYFFRSSGFPGL